MISQGRNNNWSKLLTSDLTGAPMCSNGKSNCFATEQFGSVFSNAKGQNDQSCHNKEINMLWTIFVVLLVLWLLGFSLHIAGGLIHLLLVVALVVLVINLFSGRRV
jgi:hypothetical protein